MKKDNILRFDGFEPANTTPVPDILFNQIMQELTGNELKAILYIIKRTLGFKKQKDDISLSQFQNGITTKEGEVLDRGCGIKRRTTLVQTLNDLEKKGYIERGKQKRENGDNATTSYRINFKGSGESDTTPGNTITTTPSGESDTTLVDKVTLGSGESDTTSNENNASNLSLGSGESDTRGSGESDTHKYDNKHTYVRSPDAATITLSPEEKRIFDLFCQIEIRPNITSKVKAQCAKLAPDIRTLEDMKSLHAFALEKLGDVKNKRLFLGNLDGAVGAWKNKVLVPAGQSTPPRNYSDHKIDHHSDPWT